MVILRSCKYGNAIAVGSGSFPIATSGRFKSYRSGRSRIILRARSVSMTFFLSGNSSCIIFAVVRITLLLLDFSSEYFVLS